VGNTKNLQGVHLRVVGVCDSKSLVVVADVLTAELDDSFLKFVVSNPMALHCRLLQILVAVHLLFFFSFFLFKSFVVVSLPVVLQYLAITLQQAAKLFGVLICRMTKR